MFEVLKSLYMICTSEVCKKAKPRAAPIAILSLLSQDSGSVLDLPTRNENSEVKQNKFVMVNKKKCYFQFPVFIIDFVLLKM